MATNPSRPNILIAGGAGFIGSHLCERFLADGFHVICVDNLLTGRLENVDHLLGTPPFYVSASRYIHFVRRWV